MDVAQLYQGRQPVDKDDLQIEIDLWERDTGQLPTNAQIEKMAKDLVAKGKRELDTPKHDSPMLSLTRSTNRKSSSLKSA